VCVCLTYKCGRECVCVCVLFVGGACVRAAVRGWGRACQIIEGYGRQGQSQTVRVFTMFFNTKRQTFHAV
jgi:hypothetical protein